MKKIILLLCSVALLISLSACGGDPFENSIYSEQPEIGLYQDYLAQNPELPSEGTAPILKTGTEKGIVKKGKLLFKDSNGNGKLDPYEDWRLTPRERATDLASQMSNDMKAGLFNWLHGNGNAAMTKDDKGTEDASVDVLYFGIGFIEEDGTIVEMSEGSNGPASTFANSIVNHGTRYATQGMNQDPMNEVKYTNNIQGLAERTEWGIPMIMSADPLHVGWNSNEMDTTRVSQWPYYIGLGSADDLKTTKAFGETVAAEMRMSGRHIMLGPQADIGTEPRWARVQHTLHSNGDAAAKHMSVLIKAMQGGNSLSTDGMATTVKHFPGAGSNEEGMDSHTAAGKYSVFPGNNLDEHLKPFRAAIEAGATSVMACYSIIDIDEYKDEKDGKLVNEGAAFSKKIMTDLLRDELGFDGSTVSDWGIAKDSAWGHMDIQEKPELFAELMNAGTYQYGGNDYTEKWREVFEFELVSQETIDYAAIRSLELQFKLGLFENPYIDLAEAEAFWNPEGDALKERFAAGEKAMKKAMVLAENEDVAENLDMLPILGLSDEYINAVDRNGNGQIDVYFDSVFPDADSGQEKTKAFSTETQYLNINFVETAAEADVYIARMFSRGSTYFGTLGGTPLSFDDPVMVYDHDAQAYTDEEVRHIAHPGEAFASFGTWTFDDWSQFSGPGMVGQGFQTYLGGVHSKAVIEKALAAKAANPGLKIIIGMTASRPGIVTDFYDKVDAFIIDFAATDKAFLDVVFWQDGDKPEGRLPIEFPRDNESVEAQLEDVAGDSANPVYGTGHGLNYASMGGYGG